MLGSTGKPVFVIADHDATVRRLLTAELVESGFAVVAYADGLAALKHFALGERVDVLITGTLSGEHDSDFLASEVRVQRPAVPIVSIPSPVAGSGPRAVEWLSEWRQAIVRDIRRASVDRLVAGRLRVRHRSEPADSDLVGA